MKRHLLHRMATLLAGACLVMTSCSNSDDETKTPLTPNFPAKVTPTVEAGGFCKIEIKPNMDWEVIVPTEVGTYFWIQDGATTTMNMRGKAGSFEIIIKVADQEEFDDVRVCDVKMKMGGKEEIIATITRGKLTREIKVYSSIVEDNNFKNDESEDPQFQHVYTSEPISAIDMIWPDAMVGFAHYLKIESNFDWAIGGTIPAWVNIPNATGKAGITGDIQLIGIASVYPLKGGTGELKIIDAATHTEVTTIQINIPACENICRISRIEKDIPLEFNGKGQYWSDRNSSWNDGGAIADITSIKGSKFFTVVKDENGYYGSPEKTNWVIYDETPWDTTSDDIAQLRGFTIKTKPNTGEARSAELIALPAPLAEKITDPDTQLFSSDYMSIKEEYQPYVFATLNQGFSTGVITANTPAKMLEVGAELKKISAGDWPASEFGAAENYQLTYKYSHSWERSDLIVDKTYTDYAVYGYNGSSDLLDKATSWVKVEKTNIGIVIRMDPSKNTSIGPEGQNEAFVVFSDAEGKFAMVYCVFDPNAAIGGDKFGIAFANPSGVEASVATLEEITDPSDEDYDAEQINQGIPMYRLTYKTANAAEVATLAIKGSYASYTSYPFGNEWLFLSDNTVYMDSPKSERGSIAFTDAGGMKTYAVLICVLDLPAAE